jgi:asparagine synthetase B (glutamine-hydrolysing)
VTTHHTKKLVKAINELASAKKITGSLSLGVYCTRYVHSTVPSKVRIQPRLRCLGQEICKIYAFFKQCAYLPVGTVCIFRPSMHSIYLWSKYAYLPGCIREVTCRMSVFIISSTHTHSVSTYLFLYSSNSTALYLSGGVDSSFYLLCYKQSVRPNASASAP